MSAKAPKVTLVIAGDAGGAKKALQGVDKSFDHSEGKAGKFGKSIVGGFGSIVKSAGLAAVAIGAVAVVGMAKFGKEAITLQATIGKTATVFGDQTASVEKWAAKNAAAMGLAKNEAAGLAANFGDLLIPMGFTRKEAAGMSTDVVGLSGALSAWSKGNKSAGEVSGILAKAVLGERDGLKELGISISEADVKARLLANGTDKLTGKALEQAKAMATQELIFEKSADAQAAYGDGVDNLYEKQLKLEGAYKSIKETLAGAMIPIMERLMPIFAKVAEGAKVFFDTLFGPDKQAMAENGPFQAVQKAALVVKDAMSILWDFAVHTAWPEIQKAIKTVAQWLSDNRPTIELVFSKIKDAVSALWDFAVKKAWPEIKSVIAGVFKWLTDNRPAIEAVFSKISAAMGALYAFARDEVFPGIKSAIDTLRKWLFDGGENSNAAKFKNIWTNIAVVLQKLWDLFMIAWPGIKLVVKAQWDIVKPILSGMFTALDKLVGALRWMVDNGSKAWGWVSKIPSKVPSWVPGFGDIDAAGLAQLMGMNQASKFVANKTGGMSANTGGVWDSVRSSFPGAKFMGGFNYRTIAGTNKLSDHATGHAFDVGGSSGTMRSIASMLSMSFGRLPIKYLIYNRKIDSGGGWRAYKGANPHTDHVHVSTYDQGGWLMPGVTLATNKTGRPERILGPQESASQRPIELILDLGQGIRDRFRIEFDAQGRALVQARRAR